MILQTIFEGYGSLFVLVRAFDICMGAVGMVHLYSHKVQERGRFVYEIQN